ncbi:MAG: rRNA pseudouridine synthase [Actinomycetes bacterium]|jgi:23S rRNA pseudouridine2605 synthase|nr:rRNA pseudouridine synthase [Actinomycetes bacterium]
MSSIRLQRFLARAGAASRRGSENLMTAGRVQVNGVVITELGSKVDPDTDRVTVDGIPVTLTDTRHYLMLNKPTGYVTTMDDPQGRATVAELVSDARIPGLFPVGRLDRDTSGLLLFTTDGELAHRVLHPKWHVTKRYVATVEGRFTESQLQRLRDGIELEDGPTAPATVELLGARGRTSTVAIAIHEGRKRQVRRMCSAVGHPVITLERTHFGPLELGDLPAAQWRPLTDTERGALLSAVDMTPDSAPSASDASPDTASRTTPDADTAG